MRVDLENTGLVRQRRKVEEDAKHLRERLLFYQHKEQEEAERKAKERREEMIVEI